MTAATALAAGTLGGTLFGFSTFVMPALDALPSGQAIEAMQAINDRAPRSLLMVPLAGSAAGSLATGLLALLPGAANRARLLAGSAAGLAPVLITARYHVPRNNALARLDPRAPDAPGQWARFAAGWTRWNHVRAGAALAAAAILAWLSRAAAALGRKARIFRRTRLRRGVSVSPGPELMITSTFHSVRGTKRWKL